MDRLKIEDVKKWPAGGLTVPLRLSSSTGSTGFCVVERFFVGGRLSRKQQAQAGSCAGKGL